MKVVCTHCGLPFSAARVEPDKPAFCCSGCAFAFRLSAPTPAGPGAPAPVLLTALGFGFLFLNQALAALLAHLALASRFFVVGSLGAGLLAWGSLVFFQRGNGVWRGSDRVAAAAMLALLTWSVAESRPGPALLGNALFLAWALRGLARKKVPRKK